MTLRLTSCLILIQFLLVSEGRGLSTRPMRAPKPSHYEQTYDQTYEQTYEHGQVNNPLLHKVRVIGEVDERILIENINSQKDIDPLILNKGKSNEYEITTDDLNQFTASVGFVHCKYMEPKETEPDALPDGLTATGALIGSNQVVTTTKHSFKKIIGEERAVNHDSCTFTNFLGEQVKIELSDDDKAALKVFAHGQPLGNDQISVRLAVPMRATPFAMDDSPLKVGDEFVGITAYEHHFSQLTVDSSPILRRSVITHLSAKGFYSLADFDHGGSGGVNLFVRNNKLVAKGIFEALVRDNATGAEFTRSTVLNNSAIRKKKK